MTKVRFNKLFPSRKYPDREEVELCREWLGTHTRHCHGIDQSMNSYRFKHLVERWIDAKNGGHRHISNEAFVLAAIESCYRYRREKGTDHFCFNIIPANPRPGTTLVYYQNDRLKTIISEGAYDQEGAAW